MPLYAPLKYDGSDAAGTMHLAGQGLQFQQQSFWNWFMEHIGQRLDSIVWLRNKNLLACGGST
jgi:hypothetical protein